MTQDSILIEIILWLFLIVPGVIYSLWRLTTRAKACPACGTPSLVPLNSPMGCNSAPSWPSPPAQRRCPMRSALLTLALLAALVAAASAQTARPVDTHAFGLLALGMSQDEVAARLGPPASVERETRTVLVPLVPLHGERRRDRAPAYGVRTTEVEWWTYPEGGGSMATVLEFHDGELYRKDKYR